jgi:hypothetical protein
LDPNNFASQHFSGHTGMAKKHTGTVRFVTDVASAKAASAASHKIALLS